MVENRKILAKFQEKRLRMKFKSINKIKLLSLTMGNHYRAPSGNETKRKMFGLNRLKLNMKGKSILSIAIILLLLVSVFAFIPKKNTSESITPVSTNTPTTPPTVVPQNNSQPSALDPFSQISHLWTGFSDKVVQVIAPESPGVIESSKGMNKIVWQQVAASAWQYFQPSMGVDSNTGLPLSGINVPCFTDWDLGVYIQAVMDAQKIGLISTDGDWGSSARLEKVVYFLENRELNATTGYPYWFYQSDGENYRANSDYATNPVDGVDTGRLFVALNNLRIFNASLAQNITNIVFHRSNYAALVPNILAESQYSTSIYTYYFGCGYASFWPDQLSGVPNRILNNILSSATVTTNNITLPVSSILGDPLLCSVFELNNNNSKLMTIMRQVYLAHEAYFNATGVYRAFSEGPSLSDHWAYEWTVLPDNRTWVILDEKNQPFNISPIIYTKIALGFLAIYNTTYAYNMNVYLEKALPAPSDGYCEGVTEDGAQLTRMGLNSNGLILAAAKYALQNYP